MRRLMIAACGLILLTGCSTVSSRIFHKTRADVVVPPPPPVDPSIWDALANGPLIQHITADAARTRAWADTMHTAGTLDDWHYKLAYQCPDGADHIKAVWAQKVYAFRDLLAGLNLPVTPGSPEIDLIYLATVRNLGPPGTGLDPLTQLHNVRRDFISLLNDFNATCGWLVQADLNRLYALLIKAGVLASTSGAALPALGTEVGPVLRGLQGLPRLP